MARSKHLPIGIIITWLGNDNKIHTQSIAVQYPGWVDKTGSAKMTLIYAKTELLIHQIDCWGVEGQVLPQPMMTTGLTRDEAKQSYQNELKQTTIVRRLK